MAAIPPNDPKGKGKERVTVEPEDEGDFDELDDVLDQFKAAPVETKAAGTNKAQTGQNGGHDEDDEDDDDDFEAVFAAELAKEMEKMLGRQDAGSGSDSGAARSQAAIPQPTAEEDRAFKEMFDKFIKAGGGLDGEGGEDAEPDLEELTKLMNGLTGVSAGNAASKATSSIPSTSAAAPGATPSFQDSIKATMSKLAESEAQHKSRTGKASAGANSDDPLAALMAQMEALGAGGAGGTGGGAGEEDLPELLDGLMDQLMSKELLAEPIAELKVKYPEYLSSDEGKTLPQAEKDRYQLQSNIIHEISDIFEDPKYSDADKATREKVAELMQKMQEAGSPPKHLLGELGPAMGPLGDGSEEGCTVS